MKSKYLIVLAIVVALLVGTSYLFFQISGATQPSTSAKAPVPPEKKAPSAAVTNPGATPGQTEQFPSVAATKPITPLEPGTQPVKEPIVTKEPIIAKDSKKNLRHQTGLPAPSVSKSPLLIQDFEECIIPPTNWTVVVSGNPYTWEVGYYPYEGSCNAVCFYDQGYTGTQDEWLISPVINLTTKGSAWHLYFYWEMSYYWAVNPYDNYELEVWISTDGGTTWPTKLWCEDDVGVFSNWTWYKADVNLAAYLTQTTVKLAFRYYGYDGAEADVDYVTIDTEPIGRCCYGDPSAPTCADVTPSVCTGLGGTFTDGLNCTDNPCPIAGAGDNCSAPIVVNLPTQLPYSDLSQTTCGKGHDYDYMTCLNPYDGGEDIIYQVNVASAMNVNIVLDPKTDTWTGIAIDDACPPGSPCMAYATNSGASVYGLYGIHLEPGTYYIMIDTWPSPDCIAVFDLTITEAGAAPPNDECTGAPIINTFPTTVYGTTTGATIDCPDVLAWNAVWYQFDVPYASNNVTVDFCATENNINTVGVVLYNSCPPDCPAYMLYSGYQWLTCPNTYYNPQVWWNDLPGPASYWFPVYLGVPMDFGFTVSVEEAVPCDVVCPPEGIPEGEPVCYDEYVDNYNGGCNSSPYVFQTINCNTTICGTSGTYLYTGLNYRDTDWFRVVITAPTTLTWSAVAEFPVLIFIINGGTENCADYTILGSFTANPCDTAKLTFDVQPGVYWLWVGPSVFSGYPCGLEYVAIVQCEVATTGACCNDFDPYTCTIETPEACAAMPNHTFQGLGTNCGPPNPCLPAPPNDDCEDAELIANVPVCPDVQLVTGTTIGATNDCPGVFDWPGVWYKFELPYAYNNLYVDFCPTNNSNVGTRSIALLNSCDNCAGWIPASNYGWVVCTSGYYDLQENWRRLPAGWYFLPVLAWDYNGLSMDFAFNICVEEAPPPGPGDVCATAIVVPSLPYTTTGYSCDFSNDYDETCPYSGGTAPDLVYSYSPATDQAIDIDLCNSSYDTKVFVYEDVCPTSPYYGCNDDLCGDDGWKSAILGLNVYAGHTYYIVVDGYGSSCGNYDLLIREAVPCDVVCPPDGILENEPPCEDDWEDVWNGGCNSSPYVFENVLCNTTVCGTSGTYLYYGSQYRDTDWFRVEVSDGDLTFKCVAEFPLLLFLIDAGSEDCADYSILGNITANMCDTAVLSMWVPSGVYWLWVGPSVFTGYPCGLEYVMQVQCTGFGPQIAVDPTSFDQLLNPTGACSSATKDLIISSVGGEDLNWSIAENPSVNWLAESPLSGTLPPGQTATLDVSFNAGGMAPGDYNTSLDITSNAPKGVVSVPVHLKVELPPEINVISRLWVPVIPGCSMDKALRVNNLGTGELRFEVEVKGTPPPLGAPQGMNQEKIFNLVPNRNAEDLFKSAAFSSGKGTGTLTTVAPSDVSKVSIPPSGPSLAPKDIQDVIWDNGGDTGYAFSSQLDEVYPFDSQVADDFIFDVGMDVTDVHWWGNFWNGTAFDPCDFYIYIYADDGSGTQPTGAGMEHPQVTALATYFFSQVTGYPLSDNGNYEYNVTLSPPFQATGEVKYWLVVQPVFPYPPQWGWVNTDQVHLNLSVQGFPLLGYPFWTLYTGVDMAFYLTGEESMVCPFTVYPEEGSIPAESFFDVFLTFDGTVFEDCMEETLTCYLVFTSNDCDEPQVTVPVSMWSARGDVNGDCRLDVVDIVFLLNYIFVGGPAPDPLCIGDVNRSGGNPDSDDALYLISYLFLYGPPPEIPLAPIK